MDPTLATLPPSPTTSSHGGQLPQGFDKLVHHNNSATSFSNEHFVIRAASLRRRMVTPTPHAGMSPHVIEYGPQPKQQQPAYAKDFTYQSQPLHDTHDGAYPSQPDDVCSPSATHVRADILENLPVYTTPASSPSQRSDKASAQNGTTPRSTTETRTPTYKDRLQKPKRKKGREKSDKDKVILERPLSEMGEEWKKSMMEIETYINRPAEERRNEADSDRKQPGRIKRPMNSFMLYRKAFQNHTKAYCEHNNHQVVSKVCGASWDMEPESIRKQFADWAKQERTNHQKAHPGYKFAPAKPNKAPKRKNDSDDEASDLESYDWESRQRVKRGRSRTRTPGPEHDQYVPQQRYYPQPPSQYGQYPTTVNSRNAMLSSYAFSNPNREMPYNAATVGQPGQYLSSNAMANQHYGQRGYVEDVSYHKTTSPSHTYHHLMDPPLISYVSATQQRSLEHTPPPAQFMQDGRVDPGMYAGVNSNQFDHDDPHHGIETSPFSVRYPSDHVGQPSLGGGLSSEFGGESILQDQQAQQLFRGSDESWAIQPLGSLGDGNTGEHYGGNWSVDPCLSQPYAVNDLPEAFPGHD